MAKVGTEISRPDALLWRGTARCTVPDPSDGYFALTPELGVDLSQLVTRVVPLEAGTEYPAS